MKKKSLIGGFTLGLFGILFTPNTVFAAANFDQFLTEGKFVINGVEPKNDFELSDRVGEYFYNLEAYDYSIDTDSCNSTYTSCNLAYKQNRADEETKKVEIVYNYDSDVKTVVDNLIKNMGTNKTFELSDIELLNYYLYKNNESSLAGFSSKFRKAIGYKNFSIDVRAGDDHEFYVSNLGIAQFKYNNTVYSYEDGFEVNGKHIIYVPSDTTDIKEAIKKIITNNFGNNINVQILDGDTISSFLAAKKEEFRSNYNPSNSYYASLGYANADEYAEASMNEMYYDSNATYHFLTESNLESNYYIIKIGNKSYKFAVVKDTSKITKTEKYQTIDIDSNVEINTSNVLPLDTLISVAKITSGTEYSRIIGILKATNVEMFDLKLFSKVNNNYITKLDNGEFEVKIPLKEEFKGKNLVVYYVDAEGNKTEYPVTEKEEYAIFKTTHFSIYTLAIKQSDNGNNNENQNNNQNNNTNAEESNSGENNSSQKSNTVNEKNPQTYDGIISWILVGLISIGGISGTIIYRRKQKI